jgi:DNA-binding IclR family transcriptional regulator
MMNIMRTLHESYVPGDEAFGTHLEIVFIALSLAIGQIEGKPFSVAKLAAYMHVPRTTIIRRLNQLQDWGLIDRQGHRYYIHPKTLNSLIGMRSYHKNRRILREANEEFAILDTLPD